MVATRLIQLIEVHAESLTQASVHDLLRNERTRCLHQAPESGTRIAGGRHLCHLGRCLATRKASRDWGKTKNPRPRTPLSSPGLVCCQN